MSDKLNGFFLIDDFITPNEEKKLVRNIDNQEWIIDYQRRVQFYNYRNELVKPYDLVPYDHPIPNFIEKLIDRMIDEDIIEERPDQVIINEYLPGQGLKPHRDRVTYFKNIILGLSLLSGTIMDFVPIDYRIKDKRSIYIPPRSLYIMEDEARLKWLHGIAPRKKDKIDEEIIPRGRRISITFRYVKLEKVKYI